MKQQKLSIDITGCCFIVQETTVWLTKDVLVIEII